MALVRWVASIVAWAAVLGQVVAPGWRRERTGVEARGARLLLARKHCCQLPARGVAGCCAMFARRVGRFTIDVVHRLRRVGRYGAVCEPQAAPGLRAPTQGCVQLVSGGESRLGGQGQGGGLGVRRRSQRLPALRDGRRPPSADGHGVPVPPARALRRGVRWPPHPATRNHPAPSRGSGGPGTRTPHAAPRRTGGDGRGRGRKGDHGRGRLAAHRRPRCCIHGRRAARLARGRATHTTREGACPGGATRAAAG